MGYDAKATLVRKEIKQLAGSNKTFLKLMKNAIKEAENSKSRKFSDPAVAQKGGNRNTPQENSKV